MGYQQSSITCFGYTQAAASITAFYSTLCTVHLGERVPSCVLTAAVTD